MLNWLKKLLQRKPTVRMPAYLAAINPADTQKVLRTKQRIARIESYLPKAPKSALYKADLARLRTALKVNGIEK